MTNPVDEGLKLLTRFKPRLGSFLTRHIQTANEQAIAGNSLRAWPLYVVAVTALQNASEDTGHEEAAFEEPNKSELICYSGADNYSDLLVNTSISKPTNGVPYLTNCASAPNSLRGGSPDSGFETSIIAVLDAIESDVVSLFIELTCFLVSWVALADIFCFD